MTTAGAHLDHECIEALDWQSLFGDACDLLGLCCNGWPGSTWLWLLPGVNYFVRSASIILAGLLTRVFWVDFSSVGGGYAIVMGE
jgi:hypothetical protein